MGHKYSQKIIDYMKKIPVYPEQISKYAIDSKGLKNFQIPPAALVCEDGQYLCWMNQKARDDFFNTCEGREEIFIPDL